MFSSADPSRRSSSGRGGGRVVYAAESLADEPSSVNQAIHGAFIANGGEPSVGTNILDQTYRIQAWNFESGQPPDLCDAGRNIVVRRAKLHNDSSCDISQDGRILCTFIQNSRTFNGDVTLGVFSLLPANRGQCLYTKIFGPNAISVSVSPLNQFILVGLAAKRFSWIFSPKQLIAQVFELKNMGAGDSSMHLVHDVMHSCDVELRPPISMNSARWLLAPGDGLVYGTNRGDLHILRPGYAEREKHDDDLVSNSSTVDPPNISSRDVDPIRQQLRRILGLAVPAAARTTSTATQTGSNALRSAGTQTDSASSSASASGSVDVITSSFL